jgi:hypothetical protein
MQFKKSIVTILNSAASICLALSILVLIMKFILYITNFTTTLAWISICIISILILAISSKPNKGEE